MSAIERFHCSPKQHKIQILCLVEGSLGDSLEYIKKTLHSGLMLYSLTDSLKSMSQGFLQFKYQTMANCGLLSLRHTKGKFRDMKQS